MTPGDAPRAPIPVRSVAVPPRPAGPPPGGTEPEATAPGKAEDDAGGAARPGTGPAQGVAPAPRSDVSPPAPAGARDEHAIDVEGEAWIARVEGAGVAGTGRRGLAHLVAVRFYRDAERDTAVREALVAAGALAGLTPADWVRLFRSSAQLRTPAG